MCVCARVYVRVCILRLRAAQSAQRCKFYLYLKYNINNIILIVKLINPAAISEISFIKYPCKNHNKFVNKINKRELKDKSFT